MTTYDITDHDQIFKTLIKEFFREYMELFLPELAARLTLDNPALPVEFLDKEIFTDFPTGDRRHLDILAKVWTRSTGWCRARAASASPAATTTTSASA